MLRFEFERFADYKRGVVHRFTFANARRRLEFERVGGLRFVVAFVRAVRDGAPSLAFERYGKSSIIM